MITTPHTSGVKPSRRPYSATRPHSGERSTPENEKHSEGTDSWTFRAHSDGEFCRSWSGADDREADDDLDFDDVADDGEDGEPGEVGLDRKSVV